MRLVVCNGHHRARALFGLFQDCGNGMRGGEVVAEQGGKRAKTILVNRPRFLDDLKTVRVEVVYLGPQSNTQIYVNATLALNYGNNFSWKINLMDIIHIVGALR